MKYYYKGSNTDNVYSTLTQNLYVLSLCTMYVPLPRPGGSLSQSGTQPCTTYMYYIIYLCIDPEAFIAHLVGDHVLYNVLFTFALTLWQSEHTW